MTAERSSIRRSRSDFMEVSPAIECPHVVDDLVELVGCELWIDGQRQHFRRRTLRLGVAPGLVAEVREAWLEVQRQRIVDRCADALRLEIILKLVPARDADRVLVEDRLVRRIDERDDDLGYIAERLGVV